MKFFYLILIFIVLISCSPKEISSNQLVERNNIFYEINSDKPYSGYTYHTYQNGQFKYKSIYKKGKLDGPKEEYHDNGQLLASITYKENKIVDGLVKIFDKDGILKKTESYKNGSKNGPIQTYHPDGSISEKYNYEEGFRSPEYESYHPNGQLSIKSNSYSGSYERYYPNGQLELKTTKAGWENNGATEEYTTLGQLKAKGIYSSGKIIDGEIRYYDDSMNLKGINRYSDGDLIIEESYYENGQIASKEETFKSERSGSKSLITYFNNGNIKSKGEYKRYRKVGLHEEFYANGKPKQRSNFIHVGGDGPASWPAVKKDGMQEYWDLSGKYRRECYAVGEFVEMWNCDEQEKLNRERQIEQERKDLLREKKVAKNNLAKAIIESRNLDLIEIKIKRILQSMGESLYIDIAREGCEKIIGFDIGVQLVLINDAIIQARPLIVDESDCSRRFRVAYTRLKNGDDLIFQDAMSSIGIEKNTMYDVRMAFKEINFEILKVNSFNCDKKEKYKHDQLTDLKKLCWYQYPPLDDKDTLNKHITFSWVNE